MHSTQGESGESGESGAKERGEGARWRTKMTRPAGNLWPNRSSRPPETENCDKTKGLFSKKKTGEKWKKVRRRGGRRTKAEGGVCGIKDNCKEPYNVRHLPLMSLKEGGGETQDPNDSVSVCSAHMCVSVCV